jgi:hypothetical protein
MTIFNETLPQITIKLQLALGTLRAIDIRYESEPIDI